MAINRDDFRAIIEHNSRHLPYWARSTNPIVRRHLGLYWRTVPPEMRPIFTAVGFWAVIFVIGAFVPFVLSLTLMLFLASIMVVPIGMIIYGHVLLTVAINAAQAMQQEVSNNTFQLLRTTPMSLEQIFLGKVAAALWRRMDDLILVVQITAFFSPPILFSIYTQVWALESDPLLLSVLVVLGLVVSLLRLLLEPIMFGMMAIAIGLVLPARHMAITTTVIFGVFYVVLLNLFTNLPQIAGDPIWTILLQFVLPVVLPLLLIFSFLYFAKSFVMSDSTAP